MKALKNWIVDQLRWAAYLSAAVLAVLAAEYASRRAEPRACWTCRYVAHQMGRRIPEGFACGPDALDHFVDDLTAYNAYCHANNVPVDFDFN